MAEELTEKEFYYHEIEGFAVTDEVYGPIGKVIHVVDQSKNPLIAIDRSKHSPLESTLHAPHLLPYELLEKFV